MAARAIWKGSLKLNSTRVPVKLYAAAQDRTVHFHVLEQRTRMRVKQHMVDPETGKEVPADEIQKGYEVEPGTFVILTDEELERLEPKPSRDIEITEFVNPSQINHQWFDRPYYLGPDGDSKDYFALVEALKATKKEGLAHWVMRDKAYAGALRAEGDYLMLFTLRHAEEVLSVEDLPKPEGRAMDRKEVNMARQLVEMLEGDFHAEDFRDEYRDRVMEFIEQKAKGKARKLAPVRTKRAPASLESVLAKSIQSLKKGKKAA